MDEAKRAADTPYGITGFTPVRYEAEESGKVFFCGCKATANQPLCDGSHK
jgi:CDGSH-type Zn-finger protein